MVKIRLRRLGAKKRPYFRVVVADSRAPRDGRFIEQIGKYHPMVNPSLMEVDEERALHWLQTGAQPTDAVKVILRKTGIWEKFTGESEPEPPPAPTPAPEPAEAEVPAEEVPAPEAEEAAEEEPPAEPAEATESAEATEEPAEDAPEES